MDLDVGKVVWGCMKYNCTLMLIMVGKRENITWFRGVFVTALICVDRS